MQINDLTTHMDAGYLSLAITGYRKRQIRPDPGSREDHRHLQGRSRGFAEGMGFEMLHGIMDCLWPKGVLVFREALVKEMSILT
jgi:hypothetical protein